MVHRQVLVTPPVEGNPARNRPQPAEPAVQRVAVEDRLVGVAVEVDPHVDAAGPAEPGSGPQRETELLPGSHEAGNLRMQPEPERGADGGEVQEAEQQAVRVLRVGEPAAEPGGSGHQVRRAGPGPALDVGGEVKHRQRQRERQPGPPEERAPDRGQRQERVERAQDGVTQKSGHGEPPRQAADSGRLSP